MHFDHFDTLTPARLEEVRRFLDRCGSGDGTDALGEAKRSQLAVGAAQYSGVLARDHSQPGHVTGYAHVRWETGGGDPVASAEVVTDPRREDAAAIGAGLLDTVRDRVAAAGGGTLHVWAHRVADPSQTLPAAAGFAVSRSLAVMDRNLVDPPEDVSPPPGVLLRAYEPSADDAELLRVNNAAFAGHPEQGGWDAATLQARRRLPWFNPAAVLTAWRDGRLLGFHWTKVHDDGTGEVYVLGVAPEAQGLGLGRVLLAAGLRYLYERGCRRVLLYVDRANEGAFGLYASAGFRTMHHEVCYAEVVRSGEAGASGSSGESSDVSAP